MKIRFNTSKVAQLKEYFNIGWFKEEESNYCFFLILFGREFSWDFYKKDSIWEDYYEDEDDLY